jgi:hypothetical protein
LQSGCQIARLQPVCSCNRAAIELSDSLVAIGLALSWALRVCAVKHDLPLMKFQTRVFCGRLPDCAFMVSMLGLTHK